jgi:hypothetical protein
VTPVPFDPRNPNRDGEAVAVPPWELFVLEQTWDLWRGSASEIQRLTARADEWMRWHFSGVDLEPYSTLVTIGTTRWAGGGPIATIADEINARRDLFMRAWIDSSVTRRGWPLNIYEMRPRLPGRPQYPTSPVCTSAKPRSWGHRTASR